MSAVLVDTNIFIDVSSPGQHWAAWSAEALDRVQDSSVAIVNEIVYGELSVGFATKEALDAALPRDLYRREHVPYAAAFLAGQVFLEYRRRGGRRASVLPDFFIGAHAAVAGYRLLTRDATRYRTYFPRLEIIAPE